MAESNHSIKLFGAGISTDDDGDSTVLQSRNKRRRGNEYEEKGISEVEEIGEKTEHVSGSRTKEIGESNNSIKLFGVMINTENDDDNGDSVVLRSRNKGRRWNEDEQKGIFEVEEIHKSEKTGDISSSRTKEIGVVKNTENSGDSIALQSRNNWSEDEHKKFLIGLEKLGKGKWTEIAKEFVQTRTPTQVASHAQKYFGRQKEKREFRRYKSSVFDINLDKESSNTSTELVVAVPLKENNKEGKEALNEESPISNMDEFNGNYMSDTPNFVSPSSNADPDQSQSDRPSVHNFDLNHQI